MHRPAGARRVGDTLHGRREGLLWRGGDLAGADLGGFSERRGGAGEAVSCRVSYALEQPVLDLGVRGVGVEDGDVAG